MTQPDLPASWAVDEDAETCPNGDPDCGGLEALREGELPCSECFFDAPEDVMDTFQKRRAQREANVARVQRGDRADA